MADPQHFDLHQCRWAAFAILGVIAFGMVTRHRRSKSHLRIVIACLFCLLLMSTAQSDARAVNFVEDFENYSAHAAFAATWSPVGTPPHVLDVAFGRDSNQSLRLVPQASGDGLTNRWYRNLATPLHPTDETPVIFSFDFYLDPAGAPSNWRRDWQLADIRAYSGGDYGAGSLDGLVAMGIGSAIAANAEPYNDAYFTGRIVAPGHIDATYYTLDQLPTAAPRSSGWHSLAARIGATQTLFSIDGLPAELVPVGFTAPITTVVLGSGMPNGRSFWIDNIQINAVPEPSGLMLAAVAGLMMFTAKRRSISISMLCASREN